MLGYAFRRLSSTIPVLWLALTACFFILRLAPGGPFDGERPLPAAIKANLAAHYNLDKPLLQQYLIYLRDVLGGDLGPSFINKDFSVAEQLASGLPYTLILGGLGLILPSFLIAPILQLVFGLSLDWLPVGGWGGGAITHLVLPVTVLALPHVARISRLMRGSMIEVMSNNFIRTARSKGLSEFTIVRRHVFLLTGSIVVEQIFGLPGVGRYFINAALNRDYGMVLGTVIFYMFLIIVLNLLVDLLYAWLDPRVRIQ